jgi:hypothetical protein
MTLRRFGYRTYRVLSATLLILAAFLGSCGESPTGTGDAGTANWTLLLYDDADFPGYDPLEHFRQETCSGANVNVLVLQDSLGGPARMFQVKHDHELKVLMEMGEINMGDPATLSGFLDYAKASYPACGYVLAVYDHGGGWRGSCWDAGSNDDNLTMDEMARALEDAGGVDILLFSAPCLMGAVEAVYELRECVDFYVAAEDLSGYCWWVYAMGDLCRAIDEDRPRECRDLAGLVIDSVWENREVSCPGSWEEEVQMAAICPGRVGSLVEALDSLSVAYLKDMPLFRYHMELALDSLEVMYYQCADVYDLASWLRRFAYKPDVRRALDLVKMTALEGVFAECRGSEMADQNGLSLYLPHPYWASYDPIYGDSRYGLDFTRDTHWDELLQAYYASLTGNAPLTGHRSGFQPTGGFTPERQR